MLLSFLKKSKSLIGIGEKPCEGQEVTEEATIATEDLSIDEATLHKRMDELRETVYGECN